MVEGNRRDLCTCILRDVSHPCRTRGISHRQLLKSQWSIPAEVPNVVGGAASEAALEVAPPCLTQYWTFLSVQFWSKRVMYTSNTIVEMSPGVRWYMSTLYLVQLLETCRVFSTYEELVMQHCVLDGCRLTLPEKSFLGQMRNKPSPCIARLVALK